MITTTTWVRRGVAAQFPTKYEIDEVEMDRISKLAQMQLEEAREDLQEVQGNNKNINKKEEEKKEKGGEGDDDEDMVDGGVPLNGSDEKEKKKKKKKKKKSVEKEEEEEDDDDDDLTEYNLDHYDSDEVDEDGEKITMFGNIKSLAYHKPDEEDPYLVVPEDEEEEEEREELQILSTDSLLLAGKVEDEVAHLEVYVYEDEVDNLYVHHDIMLPAIPLCLEWLDLPPSSSSAAAAAAGDGGGQGNFVAVGSMEPDIEIWDLDVVDSMYPNAILGQGGASSTDSKKDRKKKKKKSKKTSKDYHVDAVLALAANRNHRNLLASGSADTTIKLWDLNSSQCAKSYSNHGDKVSSLDWHGTESTVLLSGGYDGSVVAVDMRAPDTKIRWTVDTDVEDVRWDPHGGHCFYVTTDSGMVYRYDARNNNSNNSTAKPIWALQAHDSSISSFDVNGRIPGYVVTGSTDKQVKLWDVSDDRPRMVVSRNLDVGKVFSTRFDPDVGFRLAVAGSKGKVQVWDTSTNAAARRAFGNRVSAFAGQEGDVQERMIGVDVDDDEEDESEEEEQALVEMRQPPGGEGEAWESMDED